MKIQLLLAMMIAAMTFGACSDNNDDNVKVPEAISQALKSKYPDATRVEWESKGTYLVADCYLNGKEAEVWFNAQGQWLLTETNLAWSDLPPAVQTTFMNSQYATWKREDIDLLEYPLQPMEYVIEVENNKAELELYYSQNGDLMKTKDVAGKDDTHWPE